MQFHIILEPNLSPDELTELGLLAEQHGLAGLWVQNYATAMDPFMSLVPLARASSRIQLGVVVVSPQELHPLKIATALLTLNELSHGRANVVIGRGGEWLGVIDGDFTPRVAALQEAVKIVRQAAQQAREAEALNTEGQFYRARYFRTPWVTQTTAPVVYAGVTKDRMLQMAACYADGIMLADLGMPTVVANRIQVINEALAVSGRNRAELRISDFVGWHVKTDPEAVAYEARRELIVRAWLSPDWLRPFLNEDEMLLVQDNQAAFLNAYRSKSGVIEGVPDEIVEKLIDGLTIATPVAKLDKALERLSDFKATGLDEIALRLHDDPAESIRLIGERVLPRFL